MFEFMNGFNKKINRLVSGEKSSKEVSYVASKELRKEINDWVKNTYLCNISFGEILYKLGFPLDKTLYLERIPDINYRTIRYGYDKDITGNQKMMLSVYNGWFSYKGVSAVDVKEIILLDDNSRRTYYCIEDKNSFEGDFKLVLEEDAITKQVGSNIYSRVINSNRIKILFKNMRTIHYNGDKLVVKDGYYDEIIINVTPSENEFMKIDNEDKLIDYLNSVSVDTGIEDIYKKICEISLGNEDKYKQIDIIFKRLDKEEAKLTYYDEKRAYVSDLGCKLQVKDGDRNYTYEYLDTNKYAISSLCCFKIIVTKGVEHFVLTGNIKDYVKGMKLDNRLELRDYLCGLDFPISISDVYKKICEISLGDINKYGWIKMECYHGRGDTTLGKKLLSLCLENGEFKSYQIDKDGKEIKISNDGKFSYTNRTLSKEMIVDMNGEVVTNCQFSSENGIESDDMGNSIYGAISEARDVKVRTKKMIDNLMNRDNS